MNRQELIAEHQLLRETWRMEARARRAANRIGWVARKARWRADTVDNHGGFALIDPFTNTILYGERFDLSAEDVIELASADTEPKGVSRKQEAV